MARPQTSSNPALWLGTAIGFALLGALALFFWPTHTPTSVPPSVPAPTPQQHSPTNPAPQNPPLQSSAPSSRPPILAKTAAKPDPKPDDFAARIDEIATWTLQDWKTIPTQERWSAAKRNDFFEQLFLPKNWTRTCPLARELLAETTERARTYQEPPETLPRASWWMLQLPEGPVPIPAMVYRQLQVQRSSRDIRPSIMLVAQGARITVSTRAPQGHTPAFFMRLRAKEEKAIDALLETNQRSYQDLALEGYEHEPGDIDCQSRRPSQELLKAWSLQLKPTMMPQAPYRPPEHLPGWIWRYEAGDQYRWNANLYPRATGTNLIAVYEVPAQSAWNQAGHAIGRVTQDTDPSTRPTWLDRLQESLVDPSAQRWQALEQSLEHSTIENFEKRF